MSGRGRHVKTDRETGRWRRGPWPAGDGFDERAEYAPQADHGAHHPWERTRLPPGRGRGHDGCDRHRPGRGDTDSPADEQTGRHLTRYTPVEWLAGKPNADRH